MKAIDLSGQVFGSRTVVGLRGSSKQGLLWECRCVCGSIAVLPGKTLRSGNRHRCVRCNGTAGHNWKTTEYSIWWNMLLRCTDSNNPAYPRYGGRGIRVCLSWTKFELFLRDMGGRPGPEYSLDRKDNDKGYYKSNCRWATSREQNRNRRDNVSLTHDGVTKLLVEWAEHMGMKEATLRRRINMGWPVEAALTKPVRPVSP